MDIQKYVDDLTARALGTVAQGRESESEAPESVLTGQAVELWSDSAGGLFLVADEEDVKLATERYGVKRSGIYSVAEIWCIVAITDPRTVYEIHTSKRKLDAVVSSSGRT